jgi:hypothetical protein
MSPESNTTVPISAFLSMTACAIIFGILHFILLKRRSQYKKLLRQYHIQSDDLAKPNNINISDTPIAISSIKSKGNDKFSFICGIRRK